MREWSLAPSDPLNLTLAADMRLCAPDYINDQIWEMEMDVSEQAELSLQTTFGLRARSMRLFPRFAEGGKVVTSPSQFSEPITVQKLYSNFVGLTFSPFNGLFVSYEVRVPRSTAICGRFIITNQLPSKRSIRFEMCSVLVPTGGHAMAHTQMQLVNVLVGQTGELIPTLFLTGGPESGPGPQPSLAVILDLDPMETRQLTWAQATAVSHQESFEQARLIAAQPWDAERARIEMINMRDTLQIQTPDEDWNAAMAFSQQTALGAFFPANEHLPKPSFVQARQPDHGYSPSGNGYDYPASWSGQSALEAYYLSNVLIGKPALIRGVLENFISVQEKNGDIDGKPGLGGQRGRHLSMPILAALAWKLYQATEDEDFLKGIFPKLLSFFWVWFSPANDRNKDGLPEWTYPYQTGYEENPLFDTGHSWSMGVDITFLHSPALAALLYNEARILVKMAEKADRGDAVTLLERQAKKIKASVDGLWNEATALYRYSDRETGLSLKGRLLGKLKGPGTLKLQEESKKPVRLLVQLQAQKPGASRPEIIVGKHASEEVSEVISGAHFRWHHNGLVATSEKAHGQIDWIQVKNIDPKDEVIISTVDCTTEDHTLLLPLWAGIPDRKRSQALLRRTILDTNRFDQPFGIPACPLLSNEETTSVCMSVHLPWNLLVAEGLLAYGFREEAASIFTKIMAAVIHNLKERSAFYQRYHAQTGQGLGERNALNGLVPVGLFLQTLGVQIISDKKVRLEGTNPFPWSVTIQFRGLKIIRAMEYTQITFPNGKSTRVENSTPCVLEQ